MVESSSQTSAAEDSGFNLTRVISIAFGVLVGLLLLILGLAVWGAVAGAESFGPVVAVIRDIMIILLALEGILIVLALVILIAQIARLVNLLQSEIKPILENTQETVQHARGTVEFVGKNLAEPVISANRYTAAVGAFVRELFRLRGALRSTDAGETDVKDNGQDEPEAAA